MGRQENVIITCVGCQFNSGVERLEEAAKEYSLDECMSYIDLLPQPNNKYNPRALSWVWIDAYNEETIIGYVPDTELDEVWDLLDNALDYEIPHTMVEMKRTGRGCIQWIQFGCVIEVA